MYFYLSVLLFSFQRPLWNAWIHTVIILTCVRETSTVFIRPALKMNVTLVSSRATVQFLIGIGIACLLDILKA